MIPAREILGNVPYWLGVAMYVATLGGVAVAAAVVAVQVRRWARGRPEGELLPLRERLRDFARRAVAQRDIAATDPRAGAMHRMIFWGFAVLFLATVLTAVEHDFGIPFLHGGFYLGFAFVADLFGLLFVVGVGAAIHRRYVVRPPALSHARRGDAVALGLLLVAGVTGFLVEGARIALAGWPTYERVSFVGWASGLLLAPLVPSGSWAAAHRGLWGVHVAAVVGLFVALRKVVESSGVMSIDTVVRVPFFALERATPGGGETWRANFFRIDRSPGGDEFSAWRPTGRTPPDFHVPREFGTLVFE
jgi:hypothetical protein